MAKPHPMIQKISGILAKDYDGEIPEKKRSQAFQRAINNWLRKSFPDCTVIPTKGAWCEASGFITKNGKYVYYSFSDYRYWSWWERVLIRTAENEKDYRGGANHYADLGNLEAEVRFLLGR